MSENQENNGSRQIDREKYKNQDKLFLTLEITVQDYIETKLKNRHNGHKLRELVSRCPAIQNIIYRKDTNTSK